MSTYHPCRTDSAEQEEASYLFCLIFGGISRLVPLFSDTDLVSKQIAFHSFGLVSEISVSMFRSSHVIGHSLSCLKDLAHGPRRQIVDDVT